MNPKIKVYYIPKNPNKKNPPIYTLYINNNNNLALSSIVNETKIITPNNTFHQNYITKEEYTRLLELNHLAYQLIHKRTETIQNFIIEEKKNTDELSKVNTEREELIKKLIKQGEIPNARNT